MNTIEAFTQAKHIGRSHKLAHNQNQPKSLSTQTHGRQSNCYKFRVKMTEMNKHQAVTSCIVHLADSANFKGVTSNKLCNGLTGLCFESPNDTIHVTVIGYSLVK